MLSLFVKPRNELVAGHILATRQQPTESLDEYLQALKTPSKDCSFKKVMATQYCNQGLRDAFIIGLQCN